MNLRYMLNIIAQACYSLVCLTLSAGHWGQPPPIGGWPDCPWGTRAKWRLRRRLLLVLLDGKVVGKEHEEAVNILPVCDLAKLACLLASLSHIPGGS